MNQVMKPLEPRYHRETTLNDLIDRLLEKGLFLTADLIIGVAGIPLIGINLRLVLAGMSTMLRYGFLRDWDEATRAWESDQRRRKVNQGDLRLEKEEQLLWSGFAAHWYEQGIYAAWRPGTMHLTNRRIVLVRHEPYEVLLELPYGEIEKLEVAKNTHFTGEEREELHLLHQSGDWKKIHVTELNRVRELLSRNLGLSLDATGEKQAGTFPAKWFRVWHRTEKKTGSLWQPGRFWIGQGRLFWSAGPKEGPVFSLWPPDLLECRVHREDLGLGLNDKPVLSLRYLSKTDPETACFSGTEEVLLYWREILQSLQGDELELCPGCGAPGAARRLLDEGCGRCGWLSPRKQKP
ncbi:gas vesicle protein [Candidatus Formimonas warabiya]|uniref:Gas vesicle structural protein n=1 Tax=Formimonas warabiya TaxID=1761012 RepID=A0A3G1KVH2_FORW1|nr:gas vesicle protein [Candidatus Formimonas warabiya]ATW26436.1 hypothetical protein DCMF_18275 [Candidatus Formimonas warabiya]